MARLIHGVGVNDCGYAVHRAEYAIDERGKKVRTYDWRCPYYKKWSAMITRCYSDKMISRDPNYADVYVCDEWLKLSSFIRWVDSQPRRDWENLELDKDILFKGNKVYSPEACVFVSRLTNTFLVKSLNYTKSTGTFFIESKGKYKSSCRNPFSGKREHLGFFDSEHEAHSAWKRRKCELSVELSKIQTDDRVSKSLGVMFL